MVKNCAVCCTVSKKLKISLKFNFLNNILRIDEYLRSTSMFLICLHYVLGFNSRFTYNEAIRNNSKTRHIVHWYNINTEKNEMKNRRITTLNSPKRLNLSKRKSGKSKLDFKQLITDTGCSKNAVDEIWKWYEN
jgi:hypothetical protein